MLHDRTAAAAPRRKKARMAAGVAAAQRDQDVVGPRPRCMKPLLGERMGALAVLGVVLAVAELADALHALDRALGLGEQEVLHLSARPAGIGHDLHVLGRQDHHALAERDAAIVGHGVGHRAQDLLGRVAAVVLDIAEAAGGIDGDARGARRIALLLAERRPGLPRVRSAMQRLYLPGLPCVDLSEMPGSIWKTLRRISRVGAADRGVGPVAGTEQVHIGVHADVVDEGPAHHAGAARSRRCWRSSRGS